MVFVRAQEGPPNIGDWKNPFTVQYFDEKGNMMIRSSGPVAWRCNNPGNLKKSPYSIGRDRRSIGIAGYGENIYAVYPDYETGHEALVVMLKGSKYHHLSLRAAMKRYDASNPGYIDTIVSMTGFDPERTINSLTDHEFIRFWKAIEKVEKWQIGREDFIEKWYISGVHKKRGVIIEYLIAKTNGDVWVKRDEALKLGENHRLHAVMVHLKNGTVYIRPERGAHRFEILT